MLKEGKFKTRTLDLQESLELQKEQATRLKKTQLDQAAARLKERLKIGGEQQSDPVQLTKEQLMAYRTPTAKGNYIAHYIVVKLIKISSRFCAIK